MRVWEGEKTTQMTIKKIKYNKPPKLKKPNSKWRGVKYSLFILDKPVLLSCTKSRIKVKMKMSEHDLHLRFTFNHIIFPKSDLYAPLEQNIVVVFISVWY